MKVKSFLINILFFILALTFTACTSESIEEEVMEQDSLVLAADKKEETEPDQRE